METENVKTRLTPNGACSITQFYSARHEALDIVGYNGYHICTDELCHSDGVVTSVGYDDNYGWCVVVTHDNGYQTFYAHIAQGCVYVKEGQKVNKGTRIGFMGMTGIGCTGSHLHFEIRLNGTRIDPLPYLNADFPKPQPSGEGFHKGDLVKVRQGASPYGTSGAYAQWIYDKTMTVYEEPCGDRVVISFNGEIEGACYDKDLTKVKVDEPLKIGDKVKITKLIDYDGVNLAGWLNDKGLWICELNGNRAVLKDVNQIVQCAIAVENLKRA